ncbi:MAG: ceramidase [bacterium]|nr:ceramidase [bacterium]
MTATYQALLTYMELGDTDCEHIGAGLFNQPINTWSSVAYIVLGLWLVVRSIRTRGAETPVEIAYGAALASIGIGSVAFHGPVPPGARLMHDLTIAAALTVIATRSVGTFRNWTQRQVLVTSGIIVVIIGAVMAVAPDAGNMLTGAVGIAAVVSETVLYRTGRQRFSSRVARILASMVILLVGAAVINVLGRTDGPLCDPGSLFQGHAVWHVLTAATFMLYGYAAFPHAPSSPASLS